MMNYEVPFGDYRSSQSNAGHFGLVETVNSLHPHPVQIKSNTNTINEANLGILAYVSEATERDKDSFHLSLQLSLFHTLHTGRRYM